MITPEQAETTVKECIKETVSHPGSYKANKSLDQMGIKTPEFLNTFKEIIRSDPDHGVKAFGHSLAAETLAAVTIETEGGGVETIVMEKATENKPAKKKKEVKL